MSNSQAWDLTATQVLTFTSHHPLAASYIFIHSGCPTLWVSTTQYPAAKLLGAFACSSGTMWICRFVLFLHGAPVHFPSVCHHTLLITLCSTLCTLAVSTVSVQITNTTPSPPPAVNSVRLDPEDLPAPQCNVLPQGLIRATLFQL